MWMIRAGQDGHVLHEFLENGIAYLGWGETGAIYPEITRATLRYRVERANPTLPVSSLALVPGMLLNFCLEVKIGDHFVTYDPQQRLYHIGTVKSDAEYETVVWGPWENWDRFEDPGYKREVDWNITLSRDFLSPAAQRYLGRPPTHYKIPYEVSEEIRRLCG